MSDGTNPNTLIHRDRGGAVETFESGATLDLKSGSLFKIDDTDYKSKLTNLVAQGSTSAEVDARCDDSAMVQAIVAAGALSVTVAVSTLAVVGGGAVTLAVPTKPAMLKIIKMITDDGNVTLALTNVVGGTAATTATFGSVGDTLVLVSDVASGKWVVLAEVGVVLS